MKSNINICACCIIRTEQKAEINEVRIKDRLDRNNIIQMEVRVDECVDELPDNE